MIWLGLRNCVETIVARLGCCFSSTVNRRLVSNCPYYSSIIQGLIDKLEIDTIGLFLIVAVIFEGSETHLPLLHVILLPLILLDKLLQNLFKSFQICLKRRSDILDRFLNQDTVDHSKALAVRG